jgi:hypothetical protein
MRAGPRRAVNSDHFGTSPAAECAIVVAVPEQFLAAVDNQPTTGSLSIKTTRTGLLPVSETPLHAVHDDDLDSVLTALGLRGPFAKGELHCKFCGAVITWDNLHSFFPDSGDIKLVCDRPECIKALLRHLDESRMA